MTALLILHRHNQPLWPRLVNAVTKLSPSFDVIVCSDEQFEFGYNATNLWLLPLSDQHHSSVAVEAIAELATPYRHIVADADPFGRELLPQLAARLDRPMLSEVTAIDSPLQWRRPAWAGEVEQCWRGDGSSLLMTVRGVSYPAQSESCLPIAAALLPVATAVAAVTQQVIPHQSPRPELAQAKTVLAVGRGVTKPEQWQWIGELADRLGAAIGGTRPVIDAGDLASELQIGQTGQLIAPDLYIGIGISGASQHLAGIKQAKTIIAVNSDEDAPLCAMADYTLIGDLDELLPNLLQHLPK